MAPDARLNRVAWRDLVPLTPGERLWELTLSLPWLAISIWAYHERLWCVGAPASFFFFLTGLRQSHNAQHACLGIGRAGHHAMLAALSVLMLASMHAVRVTHLHHHRHCLGEDDVEAGHIRMPWWRVIMTGPVLIVNLHRAAWVIAKPAAKAWIAAELVAVGVVVLAATVLPWPALRWHVGAMLLGETLTAFFAVWTVHHGCHPEGQIARTQRGWLKNVVSYSMFFHLEHHLFPAVPTCHLDRLADRLDRACPELREMRVF